MDQDLRDQAVRFLDTHRIMTLATNRPDGWPQATTVGYANEGLTIYCFVSRVSQKYNNIKRDNRVSVAIANDFTDPLQIKGLSLAAKAEPLGEREEYDRVCDIFMKRYLEYAAWTRPVPEISPLLRIVPEIVSLLDYSKGFGHTELIRVAPDERKATKSRSFWFGSK